ncbi:MAG: protein-glutamate O-methyltransferase family protein [Treponemataceae bacterium]|nr:protein-glutamate O-methyltransferase family protein [Treponemataceae bacterium]
METDKKQAEYFFIGKDEVQDLGKESFAHFTARTRFRKIFSEHCSGDYEKDFLEKTVYDALKPKASNDSNSYSLLDDNGIDHLLNTVNEKIQRYSPPEYPKIQIARESTLRQFFDCAPFFESEVLFYHALLAQKKYFSNRNDFFAKEKKDSLENSRDAFIKELNELPSPETKNSFTIDTFHKCIQYCLSANTSDLSQLNSKERFGYGVEDINLLHDDTEILFQYLKVNKKFKRFDIICDNAGKELFSDLYLAYYFLSNDIVDKVVFHLKPYPFFVSDATKEDFGFMMNAIMKYGGIQCATQCNKYIHEGKIKIEDDTFWAAPLCFKEMPKESKLREQLCNSDLIIVKGDLNYRRLVEDRDWPYTDSFLERTKGVFKDVPIFAPRVLKSDVLVGVSEAAYHTAKSSDSHGAPADQRFKGNGKWAVVHFRCNRYDHYKKEAQKENDSQSKHSGTDDNKNADAKLPATNATEQQNTKNPNNEKKNGFYITINICYTMAIVLILAMLAVSTIPVIAQTISIAHENSDLPKKQETEQVQKTQENLPTMIFASADPSEQSEPKQNVKAAELKYGDVAGRIDFTLLLTGYAIFITGTLFIPKVLLKKEVEEGLEKYAKETAKKTVDEHFQERIKSTQNELYRMDAHLSRMVAFQLHENYPVWSVGWAYRSLKRYKNLDSKKTGFIEYRDFIRFLEEGVIMSSIKKFHDKVAEKFQSEHLYESYHRDMFPLASAQHVLEEEEAKAKEENLRPAFRAIKDIVDFEYAVRFDKTNEIGEIEIGIMQHIAMCAGVFTRELCAVILWNYSKAKANSNLHGNTYDSETMMQELLKISNYGEKSGVKQEVRQKFQQMLKRTLQQIAGDRKNAPYDYYDIKNYYDTENRPILMYFLVDEESSHHKG